jgi:hypothetical protein
MELPKAFMTVVPEDTQDTNKSESILLSKETVKEFQLSYKDKLYIEGMINDFIKCRFFNNEPPDDESISSLPELILRRHINDLSCSSTSVCSTRNESDDWYPDYGSTGLMRMNTEHCHSFFTVSDPPYKNSLESIWYSTAKTPRTHVPNPKKDAEKGEPPKQEGPAKAEAASQESPYDAMRKRLREKTRNGGNSTPTVKSNSKLAMKDLRADKVWTIGTEDGGIILLVTKNTDFNSPGFTKPFYNKLRTNPYLRDSAKVDLLADRRSNDDPQTVWLCTK